jgi:uncharacterized membrane protein
MHAGVEALLWFSAIGCGVMAGTYFAFSTFVMRALSNMRPNYGMAAMAEINRVILRSPFLPLFLATTLSSATLVGIGLLRWDEPGALAMLLGGVTYTLGMFACTMILNVPLNNELDRIDFTSEEATSVWARYRKRWTRWNHLRTVASTVASSCFIFALQSG